MKNILLTIFISLTSLSANSQWVLNQLDTFYFEIMDLHFFNQDTGIITGYGKVGEGFHVRTIDGGNNWVLSDSNTHVSIRRTMDFVNDTIGYSTGQDGIIYKTSDQGITWNYHMSPYHWDDANGLTHLNDSVSLFKTNTGRIYRSKDSLNSWTLIQERINSKDHIHAHSTHPFHFINDSDGFVAGNGINKTTDQGISWSPTNADTNHFYNSIYMLDNSIGFAIGYHGILLRTNDGGINWNKNFITTQNLFDITFVNDSIGFCVGGGINQFYDTSGIVLTTLDGGISWQEEKISNYGLNAIQFIDSVGYITGSNGQVFKMLNYNILDIQNITPQISTLNTWPNPATDFIEIDIMDGTTLWDIKLFNVQGQLILSKKKTNNKRLSLKSIPTGVYFIQLESNNKFYVGKVIKS